MRAKDKAAQELLEIEKATLELNARVESLLRRLDAQIKVSMSPHPFHGYYLGEAINRVSNAIDAVSSAEILIRDAYKGVFK